MFTNSLASWLNNVKDPLQSDARSLSELSDRDLQMVSSAYGDLYVRPAAIGKTGRIRTVGPTAAANLPYFVRPCAVTA